MQRLGKARLAVGAVAEDRVAAAIGAHRSVALAMALMASGIGSMILLGEGASFLSLMPSFALIGMGGGLSVPLTALVALAYVGLLRRGRLAAPGDPAPATAAAPGDAAPQTAAPAAAQPGPEGAR